MPQTYSTKAIVLRRRPYRGYDQRVSLYTAEKGKVDLLVKGALRPASRLAAHLEPLTLLDLMVVSGRMDYAGGASSRDCYPNLKADYDKLEAAGLAINRLNRILKENVRDDEIFTLTEDFLSLLNRNAAVAEWYRYLGEVFLYKVIARLGYGLNLDRCRTCGKSLGNDAAIFATDEQSFLCAACGAGLPLTRRFDFKELSSLRELDALSLPALAAGSLKRPSLEAISTFLSFRTRLTMEELI